MLHKERSHCREKPAHPNWRKPEHISEEPVCCEEVIVQPKAAANKAQSKVSLTHPWARVQGGLQVGYGKERP